jgi:hypothetical protein
LASWELTLRRKPGGDPSEVHARLLEALAALPAPWRLPEAPRVHPRDAKATVTIRGRLDAGIAVAAHYLFRSEWHPDNADFDDVVVFAFDPARVPLAPLAGIVLPALVPAFDAYRAAVADREVLARDAPALAERRRTLGTDLDGRHGIHRLSPCAYYDAHLVEAELELTPAQFAQRARGWVREFHRGVLVTMPLLPGRSGQFESDDEALRALAAFG